jgi:hypothetical protein
MLFQFILDGGSSRGSMNGDMGPTNWILYLVLGFLAILVVFFLIHKLLKALRRPELHDLDEKKIREVWAEILKTSDHGVMGAKLSIIEADKLLDRILKSMLMPGETLGERLKYAAYKYPSIRQVWGAHRLRNQLVHDAAFELTIRQAKGALQDYEKVFKTLNVM